MLDALFCPENWATGPDFADYIIGSYQAYEKAGEAGLNVGKFASSFIST